MVLTVFKLRQMDLRPQGCETRRVRRWRWGEEVPWLGRILPGGFEVRNRFVAGREVRRNDG